MALYMQTRIIAMTLGVAGSIAKGAVERRIACVR